MTTMHLLDHYVPNLAARLGALSLDAQRRVITDACLVVADRIEDLEPELRSLIDAAAKHDGFTAEELAAVRAYAETADDRYFDLLSNAATSAESLRWFLKARLGTSLAAVFGSSDRDAAADAAYELCVIDDDAKTVLGVIEAGIEAPWRRDR